MSNPPNQKSHWQSVEMNRKRGKSLSKLMPSGRSEIYDDRRYTTVTLPSHVTLQEEERNAGENLELLVRHVWVRSGASLTLFWNLHPPLATSSHRLHATLASTGNGPHSRTVHDGLPTFQGSVGNTCQAHPSQDHDNQRGSMDELDEHTTCCVLLGYQKNNHHAITEHD